MPTDDRWHAGPAPEPGRNFPVGPIPGQYDPHDQQDYQDDSREYGPRTGAVYGAGGGDRSGTGAVYGGSGTVYGGAAGGGGGTGGGPTPRRAAPEARRSSSDLTRRGSSAHPGRRRRRSRFSGPSLILTIAAVLIGLATIGTGLLFVSGSPLSAQTASGSSNSAATGTDAETSPSPSPLAPLPFRSASVSVDTEGFWSWALMDRRTGEIVGSANMDQVSTTASMIKAWLASDYLRRAAEKGETPSSSRLHTIEIMIRDSDNDAAVTIYNLNGKTASIKRLISICKLTDSHATAGLWSKTYVSARDTVRMGNCIANGTAAGSKWTDWVLDMMRNVRGIGDFGPRKALSDAEAAQVAIKNGWLLRDEDNMWHVSCMAIGDTWVLAVLQRYPSQGTWDTDFAHTQEIAKEVATQLLNPEAQ